MAASALVAQRAATAYAAWRAAPLAMRRFYEGGFEASMSRREAALILGVRQSATEEKVKSAHKKIMIANHPDSGGSDYLAAKINEAKDMILGKKKSETCVGAPPASGPVGTDAAPPGSAGSSDFCPGCGAPCPLPLMPADFRYPPPPDAGFPFGGLNPLQVMEQVDAGERPPFPPNVPSPYRGLVEDCWQKNPAFRPAFDKILLRLQHMGGL